MIIAELCQNHNGDLNVLNEMIYKAKEAGAWACKIQSFFADDLAEGWTSDYDRLKKLELDFDKHQIFYNTCKKIDIVPMTSVYDFRYTKELNDIGFKHIKIGSAQAKDTALIMRLCVAGFDVYVSTGGQNAHTLKLPTSVKCVMHCISKYPSAWNEAGILRMLSLGRHNPNAAMGFSDHTDPDAFNWDLPVKTAIYIGAQYVEKHFTILPKSETKDGKVSITFAQLKELCDFDRLTKDEQMASTPMLGMFFCNKSQDEIELIERYRNRWKSSRQNGLLSIAPQPETDQTLA